MLNKGMPLSRFWTSSGFTVALMPGGEVSSVQAQGHQAVAYRLQLQLST